MNNLFTEILIQRHGQSLGNLTRTFLGHTDLDLSELGFIQARECAKHLLPERIDAIYSSDLKRAYNTAAEHARLRNMNIVSTPELRELFAGEWENMPVDEIKAKYPYEYGVLWRENFALFDAVGAESVPKLAQRFYKAVEKIARENPNKRVLIATHAAGIRALFGKLYGYEPHVASREIDFPTNASISRVIFDGERLIPVSYSEDSFLKDLTSSWQG